MHSLLNHSWRVAGISALVFISFSLAAQYRGGDFAGDISTGVFTIGIDGVDFSQIYHGSESKGESSNFLPSETLSGNSHQSLYLGNNGNGEVLSSMVTTLLTGEKSDVLYAGGHGNGDILSSCLNVTVSGEKIGVVFSGNFNRGEILSGANHLQLSGELEDVVYSGGLGHGEHLDVSGDEILDCTYYSIWTGSVSTAWENPANWQCGELPNRYSDVFIPSVAPHFPYITVLPVEIRNLTLENSSMLHVISVPLNVLGGPQ